MSDPIPFARHRPGGQPDHLFPDYGSTVKRAPKRPLIGVNIRCQKTRSARFSRAAGTERIGTDLTRQCKGSPMGERIIVTGQVLDEDGRPVPETLLELWQCNAAGGCSHPVDQHDAPLDPNFTGVGQIVTGDDGSIAS